MTDDKKSPEDLGEIDWDQALSEWENTSFDPEVAKDVVTDKPAALAGASRPLYRPPTISPAVKPRPPKPPPKTLPPRVPRWSLDDEETGATRVALIPEELLHPQAEEPPPEPFELAPRAPLPTQADEDVEDVEDEISSESLEEVDEPTGLFATEAKAPRAARAMLLVPKLRQFDPNEVTAVASEADLAHTRKSLLSELAEQPPEAPAARSSTLRPPIGTAPRVETRTWQSEKPASGWLSATTRDAFAARAVWLEEEARALDDDVARARGLLACSEICATMGEREQAQALAAEARDVAPSLALAHRQARALMPSPSDGDGYLEALAAEVATTPEGPARLHSALLVADTLRAAGQEEAALRALETAASMSTTDVRAAVARAANALARTEVTSAALRVPGTPELALLAEAIAVSLQLRGASRDEQAAGRERSPTEVLRLARQALDTGRAAEAAPLVAELASVPELASAATWLAASLGATQSTGRAHSARWLRELALRGDEDARRALVARAFELGDTELLTEAMGSGGPLTSAERVTLATLAGVPMLATDPHLDATASTPGMHSLAAAITSLAMPAGGERDAQIQARAQRTAGSANTRAHVCLARLLVASASSADVEVALETLGFDRGSSGAGDMLPGFDDSSAPSVDAGSEDGRSAGARAIALEMAVRAGRTSETSVMLQAWGSASGSPEDGAFGALAAALVAERAGNQARALEAFRAARAADPTNEAALRAIASLEQVDLVAEMNELADDLVDGPRAALARIEAAARGDGLLPEPTRAHMLERAHSAAPALPIASFLAERIARRAGDVDEVLRWVRERRAVSSDVVEAALDAVREALLVADREPHLAAERLQEAHRARPNDMALRELYERMGSEPPEARASWREQRATEAVGDGRILLLLSAAYEYERAGDEEGALRCAEAAGATDASLGGVARERSELRAQRVTRLAEELLSTAKGAGDARSRREAYERLAIVDSTARADPASALLWHRAILEEVPGYEPSLRHIEHHLIGEGRDEELEPIATAIAIALCGTGPGECTAHAELAARLRLRGADAKWDSTRGVVELAAAESEPSLWSLRMLQAHARARGDDAAYLAATQRLLGRALRSAEMATLLVCAGEAASRLGRLDEARALLERASVEDSGDVVAWTLLADVRRRAGDVRGAAEACEALVRCSMVPEHQLRAWHEAGCLWLDEAEDEARGIAALEAAAAIDIAYKDVFDRLAHLYASRRMVVELASVLERRIDGITDPDERLAMEVKRGRVLLEAGDVEAARRAFEAALAERPEDAGALSALADLCVSQHDWEAAEQALVRLARLLPTPEEQRSVYARLGELYSAHLVNLSRAEVALREVLKRAPDDLETTEKLVDVYKRQNDSARAAELQQELVPKAQSPEEKRRRVLELAAIHEHVGHDNRRAEQTLEALRREFPQDVGVLRALAEFYTSHHQAPAVNILLDRAGGDARRALAAGRISPALFDVLGAVFDLRGKKDAGRVARAMQAALSGQPAEIGGGGHRALDPKLDDLLAPEGLTAPVRALLVKTGDALDQVSPVDLRALKAIALPAEAPIARLAAGIAQAIGLGAIQVLVSPKLGAVCIPVGSSPPVIVVGESLPANERFAAFLVLRSLKLVHARASALARPAPADLAVLVSAWLKCFNPKWQPQGVNSALLNAVGGRLQAVLPRNVDPDVATIALEAAAAVGAQAAALGVHAIAWADRVALLALGDCNAALDAIAAAGGALAGAPRDPKERAAWVARTPAARDLVSFAVTDAFAEARAQLGLE
jgi:tetratricopeptide (TPR) repeat protein